MFGWLFKSQKESEKLIAEDKEVKSDIQHVTSLCPYCGSDFKRAVKAKSKCKNCGNFAYKRTTIGGEEVIVTEKEMQKLDLERQEQYEEMYARQEIDKIIEKYFRAELYSKKTIINELTSRFGRPPEIGDIAWYILNNEILVTLTEKRYGHYRNVKLDMFDVLYSEKRYTQALDVLMEIIYLDNSNFHLFGNRFAESRADILPFSVNLLMKLANKLNLSQMEIYDKYLNKCIEVRRQLQVDLDPKNSLIELKEKIKELKL